MMNLSELFEKGRIKHLTKQSNKKKIIDYLLKCSNIKEALNYLDERYLVDLDLEFYEIPVEGYINLYDYLINELKINPRLRPEQYQSKSIYIPHILKNKSLHLITQYITTEMLLEKMPNGQTVLEYVFDNDQYIDVQTSFVVDSIEVAKIIYKKGKINFLKEATPEILLSQIDQDKTVLDVLKENNILPRFKYIEETNKYSFDYILKPKRNELLKVINGQTLLETLIEKGFEFDIELNEIGDEEEEWKQIYLILLTTDQEHRIKKAPEAFLKTVILDKDPPAKIIDMINLENLPIILGNMSDPEIIKYYIFEGKFDDVLFGITADGLLSSIEPNLTALDLLVYMMSDKENGLMDLLQALDNRHLITPEVSVILAKFGIFISSEYTKTIGIKSDTDMFEFIYAEKEYQTDKLADSYIAKLRKAFDDGKSNPDIIELAVKSFKRTYHFDKELAIRDITALIKFKHEYENFILESKPAVGSSFSGPKSFGFYNVEPTLNINNKNNVDTLNHELGHLIQIYLGPKNIPQELKDELNGTDTINIGIYRNVFNKLNQEATEQLLSEEDYEKKFYEFITEKYQSKENYIQTIKNDFNRLIGTKDLVLEAINDGSYSQDVLLALVDAYYQDSEKGINKETLIDMYTEARINAEKEIFKEELYRKANMEFLCYENFVDAYYYGGIYECVKYMSAEEKEKIKAPICTHNRSYFVRNDNNQFSELYANYMELKKSPNGAYYIEKLKEKTSPRLVQLIEEYDQSLYESLQNEKTGKSR